MLAQWELTQNGGAITPSIRAHCEKVKALYREHFLGKVTFLGTDTLSYYSGALAILGEGCEITFSFGAAKQNAGAGAPIRARFASVEESPAGNGLESAGRHGALRVAVVLRR